MSNSRTPPRIARAILNRVIPEELRDSIDGDLFELYEARRGAAGAGAAARWYRRESLSFALRFTANRIGRAAGSLFGRGNAPSGLDLALGARMLARSPGLTIVGAFGMAVGVAIATGAYAIFNSYMYPKVPLPEGERLVALAKWDPRTQNDDEKVLHDLLVWRRELRSVNDVSAFRTVGRNLVSETGAGELVSIAEMTASGFRAARVAPLRGRALLDSDERPGAQPVVVIGHDVWQARFGGDSDIIGREIRLGRISHTIVGVMPQGYAFPVNHSYWIPLRFDPATTIEPGTGPILFAFGRLAPGATRESAQAELDVIAGRIAAAGPPDRAHLQSRVVAYTDIFGDGGGGESKAWRMLRYMIALLLVVVAMNVAVLVYARTIMRTGEIAVRTALGATRGRIVTQFFAEAFVLSGIAAAAGLGLASLALRWFDTVLAIEFDGRPPFWMDTGLSPGTVVYAFALAVLAAVIVGVLPALRATGTQLRSAIGSLGSGTKARLGRTWTALIVVQVAVAVAILPPALRLGWELMSHGLQKPGFAQGEYVMASFLVANDEDAAAPANANSDAKERARTTMNALLARLAAEPGVAGVSVARAEPWGGFFDPIEVDREGQPRKQVRVVWSTRISLMSTTCESSPGEVLRRRTPQSRNAIGRSSLIALS